MNLIFNPSTNSHMSYRLEQDVLWAKNMSRGKPHDVFWTKTYFLKKVNYIKKDTSDKVSFFCPISNNSKVKTKTKLAAERSNPTPLFIKSSIA